jgi:hypothetical protein
MSVNEYWLYLMCPCEHYGYVVRGFMWGPCERVCHFLESHGPAGAEDPSTTINNSVMFRKCCICC